MAQEHSTGLATGIYEQLVNQDFSTRLATISESCKEIQPLEAADSTGVLTAYLHTILRQALAETADASEDGEALKNQIALVNAVIQLLQNKQGEQRWQGDFVTLPAQQLLALLSEKNNEQLALSRKKKKATLPRPQTSIFFQSL